MVHHIIEELRSDNSRLAKEAILKREFNNEVFKEVLLLTYNPNVTFGIKKIPEYWQIGDTDIGFDEAFSQLHFLINREYTGNAAIGHLRNILSNLPEDKAKVIELIIGRDLKCGVSESTINKVWKNFIPEKPYMRCSLLKAMKKPDWKKGLISQTKADGAYCDIANIDGEIQISTRSGKYYDISLYPTHIVDELRDTIPFGWVVNCEQVVYENNKLLDRKTGNGVLNSVSSGEKFPINMTPRFEAWDMIPVDNFIPNGKYNVEYNKRFAHLKEVIQHSSSIVAIGSKIVYSMDEALAHYKEQLSLGLEGTVLKYQTAIWADGTSREQFKLKLKAQVELIVTGYNEGTGRNADTFGSLVCQSADGKLKVDVSGRGDEMRGKGADYYIGKVITVESNAIMFNKDKEHSLFLPIFIEVRDDKNEADSFDKIVEIFENLVK